MDTDILHFDVTGLDVWIEEGFRLRWQGRDIESGRVVIALRGTESRGIVDYANGTVNVDFHVEISLPELAEILNDMGVETALAEPVCGVIHSEGVVFEDHCFRLAGTAALDTHALFDQETKVDILAPTRCKPDNVTMSGPEIREALHGGQPVSWNFNPTEKRVTLVLPQALGGYTHSLCLAGFYTFTVTGAEVTRRQDIAA